MKWGGEEGATEPATKPHHDHACFAADVAKCRAFPVPIGVVRCEEIGLGCGDLPSSRSLPPIVHCVHSLFPRRFKHNVEHKSVTEIAREGRKNGGRKEGGRKAAFTVPTASAFVAAAAIEVEN